MKKDLLIGLRSDLGFEFEQQSRIFPARAGSKANDILEFTPDKLEE